MSEQHDPMCTVPLSYLTMLQERGDSEKQYTLNWQAERIDPDTEQAIKDGVTPQAYSTMKREYNIALNRIAEFEERAGCKLEHIPVEALGDAQNAYVSQQAIDTLKAENEALCKRINEMVSANAPTSPLRAINLQGSDAPWGLKKDGTPRKRPGRKVPRKRKVA